MTMTSTDVSPTDAPIDGASSGFVDDDSWAQPRAQAARGWRVFAGILATAILGLGFFTVGVKYQKKHPAAASGAGTFGRNFPGGLGGAGGFGAAGGAAPSNAQLSQIFNQLNGGQAGGQTGAQTPAARSTPAAGGSTGAAASSDVRGKVTKVDGSSLTITKTDGSTVTVTLASSTQIGRRTSAAADDVAVGADVVVSGVAALDGAVAADAVTLGDLPSEPTTTVEPGATPTTAARLGGLLPG